MSPYDLQLPPGVDLIALIKRAYALSSPQGLGFLHHQEGELSDEDAQAILDRGPRGRSVLSIDYLHGRAVKLRVNREGDTLYTSCRWYDHSTMALQQLLEPTGITSQQIIDAQIALDEANAAYNRENP